MKKVSLKEKKKGVLIVAYGDNEKDKELDSQLSYGLIGNETEIKLGLYLAMKDSNELYELIKHTIEVFEDTNN